VPARGKRVSCGSQNPGAAAATFGERGIMEPV
jgi:hypothetical protein